MEAGQEATSESSTSSTDTLPTATTTGAVDGRLGPKKVAFDPNSKVGNVILDSDHLGVLSLG